MQSYWKGKTVGEQGELLLDRGPFEPGQVVDVLVISRASVQIGEPQRRLRNSVLDFVDPLEPCSVGVSYARLTPPLETVPTPEDWEIAEP